MLDGPVELGLEPLSEPAPALPERLLVHYLTLTELGCGNGRRRVLQGETQVNHEKIFSIFELIKRGKQPVPIQFGMPPGSSSNCVVANGVSDQDLVVPVMKDVASAL